LRRLQWQAISSTVFALEALTNKIEKKKEVLQFYVYDALL
jgi:hypothetical protein